MKNCDTCLYKPPCILCKPTDKGINAVTNLSYREGERLMINLGRKTGERVANYYSSINNY